MKKQIVGTVIVLSILLSGIAVFAETVPVEENKTAVVILQEIKEKKEALKEIYNKNKAIRAELKSETSEIKNERVTIKDEFKAEIVASVAQGKAAILTLKERYSAISAEAQSLKAQLKEAVERKDTTKVEEIKAQLTAKKSEANDVKSQIGALQADLKQKIEAFKEGENGLPALKETVATYNEQTKVIREEQKAMHASMKEYKQTLKAAMQNKEYDAASATIDSITRLANEINAKLDQKIALKNSKLEAMKSF